MAGARNRAIAQPLSGCTVVAIIAHELHRAGVKDYEGTECLKMKVRILQIWENLWRLAIDINLDRYLTRVFDFLPFSDRLIRQVSGSSEKEVLLSTTTQQCDRALA